MAKSGKILRLMLGTVLMSFVLTVLGQGQGDACREAVKLFEEERYGEAYETFLGCNEENGMLSYYKGRCLVEMNRDLDEAIELLYKAAGSQVPQDVLFFQGRAHHLNYNFNEALKYYGRFEMKASRQDVKSCGLEQYMVSCRSARAIVSQFNPYEVLTVAFMDMNDSLEYSQIRMRGGQLRKKPARYRGENESGPEELMFYSQNQVRGDYLYYASRNKSGKDGMQLYRVRKGSGRSWSDPQEIKALNTEGNEILPYFDPIENDLYFASDGRGGIGGFDLYRAHYDGERDTWSEPMNLGFPVNSAMDEILLLPGTDLGMMMIFSNRQGTDSTYTVYRVHLVEPKRQVDVNNFTALKEIASLGGAAEELLREMQVASESRLPDETQAAIPEEIRKEEEPEVSSTQFLLSEALYHQARSDSLKDMAARARVRVRASEDPNDRWVWQKQIMVWEKKAADEEGLADALYDRLDLDKTGQEKMSAVNPPEPVREEEALVPEPVISNFEILSESPYSEEAPIPVDVPLPRKVLYRIQLGAFGSPVDPGYFGGISPICADVYPEQGVLKYYAGRFSRYEDVSRALERLRNIGYEDAFIVSWYQGKPISVQKAKQLE